MREKLYTMDDLATMSNFYSNIAIEKKLQKQ